MKKAVPAMLCVTLCLVVAFIFPHLGESWEMVNDGGCLECHDSSFPSGELHSIVAHSDCTACHDGAPTAGNVYAAACIECHPLGDIGECPLVLFHDPDMGADCLVCHVECDEPTTTTTTDVSTTTTTADVTTTTTAPVTTTTTVSASNITVSPDTVLRSRWIPLPSMLAIEGNGTNFEQRVSKPTYSPENALIKLPPLVLNAEMIWQMVLVNPAWLAQAGNQTVTCTVDGGSDDFDIKLLPLILDE